MASCELRFAQFKFNFMLSEREKHEINAVLKHAPTNASASVEALNIIQHSRGWVSDEAIKELSDYLDMTTHELDAIATFYSFIFRKPVGRHVILICDSVSCWIMGYNPLIELFKTKLSVGLGETTSDKRFTLLPISCLGACDRSPAIMIDNDLYGPVKPEMLEEILKKYN